MADELTNKQTPTGEATPQRLVSLVGADLKAALALIAPDGTEEQLETPVTIAWLTEAHSGPGYYAYLTEYPEEGCILLDGDK